jgi:hypothetical protein
LTLAAILLVYFLTVSGSTLGDPTAGSRPSLRGSASQDQTQDQKAASQAQTPPAQSANTPATSSGQPQNPSSPAKPSTKAPAHRKKTSTPDCTNSPAPLNQTGSTNAGAADAHSARNPPAKSGAAAAKPCPPPKVVVKDGGSSEPTIELTRDTPEQQASQQRFTTEQLTAATQENLKKIEGRQLNASQQEMVTQIKEFMAQAQSAVTDGDLERGHNLAMKARLLSDELVKP